MSNVEKVSVDLTGVKLCPIKGKPGAVVVVERAFGAAPTISKLALGIGVAPDDVLDDLVYLEPNRAMLPELTQHAAKLMDVVQSPHAQRAPTDYAGMRKDLRAFLTGDRRRSPRAR